MSGHHLLVMPGAPALVSELAPAHGPSRRLLGAVRGAVAEAAGRGVPAAEIVGSRDDRWRTARTGSFAAWGAPQVDVGEGNHLPELVARYALDGLMRVTGAREHIGAPAPSVLTVVVADGSAGLTDRAPRAAIHGAVEAHAATRRFLAGEGRLDVDTLGAAGVVEPYLWAELAALRPVAARLLDSDDSLGVGSYVAVWEL